MADLEKVIELVAAVSRRDPETVRADLNRGLIAIDAPPQQLSLPHVERTRVMAGASSQLNRVRTLAAQATRRSPR